MNLLSSPITEDFVLRPLKQLKTNKAIGLDNISARLLKDSALVISASLTRLLISPWKLAPFLLFGNLEKWQRYSRKVIAVMRTITDPSLCYQRSVKL